MNPFEILGITADADDTTVREAYLAKLRFFPPDKDPKGFTRLQEAFQAVQTEEKRLAASLDWEFTPPTRDEILSVFASGKKVCTVGPKLWLDLVQAATQKSEN